MKADILAGLMPHLKEVDYILEQKLQLKNGHVADFLAWDWGFWDKYFYPGLLIAAASLFGGLGARVYSLAAAVEFIHLAAKTHIYRGGNVAFPVLIGDYLYAQFFSLLCGYGNLAALRPLSEVICRINDAGVKREESKLKLTAEKSFQLLWEESSLAGEASRLGAWINGAEPKYMKALEKFGHNLGMLWFLQSYSGQGGAKRCQEAALQALGELPPGQQRDFLQQWLKELMPEAKGCLAAI